MYQSFKVFTEEEINKILTSTDKFELSQFFNSLSKENRTYFLAVIYLTDKSSTVRSIGEQIYLSKSSVHKYLKNLEQYDEELYEEYLRKAQYNFKIKYMHGGQATKTKWEKGLIKYDG